MKKLFQIRWAFFYADGRHVYGMWDLQPPEPQYWAANQSRIGLLRVEIHSRHMVSREIKRQYSLSADYFDKFQWIGAGSTAFGLRSNATQLNTVYLGLQMVLRDGSVRRFLIDGTRKG